MHILNCPNCNAQFLQQIDGIESQAASTHCHERAHCCPYCHAVVSIEVTMAAEDDSPTLSKLRSIELSELP